MYENQPFKILLSRNFENLFTGTVSKLLLIHRTVNAQECNILNIMSVLE